MGRDVTPPTNPRARRQEEQRRLFLMVLFFLVVVGDALICLIYDWRGALLGLVVLLAGAALLAGIWWLVGRLG